MSTAATAFVQGSLFDLTCAYCHLPIDTTGNYDAKLPAHVGCGFRAREGSAAAAAGDEELARWLGQLDLLGYVIGGRWRDLSAMVAEQREGAVAWDDPADGSLPWLATAKRDCPGPPYHAAADRYRGLWQCNSKHLHRRTTPIRQSYIEGDGDG